jgi:dienelactone hydrolase
LVVYDIFGFFNQTLQGADILAHTDDIKYQVFMPDFFEGKPADISWYPPDNDEKGKKLGEFFNNQAAPPKTLPRIPKIVEELGKSRGIEKWAIIGFCWGGKVCGFICDGDCDADCNRLSTSPRKKARRSRSRLHVILLWSLAMTRPASRFPTL